MVVGLQKTKSPLSSGLFLSKDSSRYKTPQEDSPEPAIGSWPQHRLQEPMLAGFPARKSPQRRLFTVVRRAMPGLASDKAFTENYP